jgi:hypothetical protein
MARAAPPHRPARPRVLRPRLGRGRADAAESSGGAGAVHALDPFHVDRRGAGHRALEVDASAGRLAARRGVAAPLAGRSAHRAEAALPPDAADRARSLQPSHRRLHSRSDGRGDRMRDLRARATEACRVPPSDRHTRCCAHRIAGRGGRSASGDAEHGVGTLTGVGGEAVSSSATRDHDWVGLRTRFAFRSRTFQARA